MKERGNPSLVLSIAVLVVGASWVLISDLVLFGLVADPATRARLETIKDWGFTAVCATVLYFMSRRLFRRLQASRALLLATLDGVADGIILLGEDGTIAAINPAGQRLLRSSRRELLGMNARAFSRRFRVSHLDGRMVPPEQFITELARSGVVLPRHTVAIYPREGERVLVESSAAPVRLSSLEKHLVVTVMRDVTEREELERLRDDFISTLAHELRSPLTSIKAHTQHLLRQSDPRFGGAPSSDSSLRAVKRACDRMERLVEQLLEAIRVKTGDLPLHVERFDLHASVEHTVERHQTRSPTHRFELSQEGPTDVFSDPRRLQEILSHLLDNAVRYSPRGGTVRVGVRELTDAVEVSVADEGVGIPLARQAHMFERYYRAHAGTDFDYGGMGIGLFVSRTLVEALGGQMGFQSEEGEGTRFWFTVPLLGVPPGPVPKDLYQRLRWAAQVEAGEAH